ncbi:MAG: hypothetical protein ACLT98_16080 [Eggerthellaceae bacterium]
MQEKSWGFASFLLIRYAAVIFIALPRSSTGARRPHPPRSTPLTDRVHYSSFFPHLYAEGHFPAEKSLDINRYAVLIGKLPSFPKFPAVFLFIFMQ